MSPYLRSHAENPVDWWPWGEEAFAEARAARRAGDDLDRLRDLPLVPRDGARELQRSGGRGVPEREPRRDQGRPRGASRGRRQLPRRGQRVHAEPRLAAHGVRDARRGRRTSPAPTSRRARSAGRRRSGRCVDAVLEAWRERRDRRRGTPGGAVREAMAAMRAVGGPAPAASTREQFDAAVGEARVARGPGVRRPRARAEVPEHPGDRVPARARRRRRRTRRRLRAPHARDDGGIRSARSGRGRVLPLRGAARLDRAALRAHAVRQRAAARRLHGGRTIRMPRQTAEGLVAFLLDVLRLPGGAFASAQDSESLVDGAAQRGRLLRARRRRPRRRSRRRRSTRRCSPG